MKNRLLPDRKLADEFCNLFMKMMKRIAAGTPTDQANSIDGEVVVVFEVTEDLILEILSRLPPISLLRFKSVSKTWYSLISNPGFLRCNTTNQFDKHWWHSANDPPSLISVAGNSNMLILPPPSHDKDEEHPYYQKLSPLLLQNLIDYHPKNDDDVKDEFKVIDSCNGFLLYIYPRERMQPIMYVCNPITHDYIKLPTLFVEETQKPFRISNPSLKIVFDPSVSLIYKVVLWLACYTIDLETNKRGEHHRLHVYSSETRSWRLSFSTNQLPVPDPSHSNWRGVLCNGVLYWSTKHHSHIPDVCLCYDIEKEVIWTLNFPKMPLQYRYRVLHYFGECGRRLRLIETYYKLGEKMDVFPSIFDVMELDNNNDDVMELVDNNDDLWTVKYRVNIGDDYYANLIRKQCRPLFRVYIMDLYKTKTKNAGEQEVDQGEDVLLLRIGDICIIPFNLSSNTFGKELPYGEKKSVGDRGCTKMLRYNTITLFPPSSS